MAKIWKLKSEIPPEIDQKLSEYPQFLRQLLYNRGLTEKSAIEEFLNPKYENLHDPFLFLDMQKAVDRIWRAIDAHQRICIYGDYDADAVTANAVLQQAFRYLGTEVLSYIPDRFTEGYGVNIDALEKIRSDGARLIITVDCGTNSTDAADFCKQNNIDLIITDHHEIIGEKPDALALINPKNPDDNYPYGEITGVGVAFKLASALLKDPRSKIQEPSRRDGYEKWLLDLVAIGTVADCHSLLGENRILVKYGLKVLAKTRWPGMRALLQSSGLDFHQKLPDAYTLGFIIAPRLNAAGRLEHADIALNLLLEQDSTAAKQKAQRLEEINQRRQNLTQSVLSEAKDKALLLKDRQIIAVWGEGWPKGIMGLVAGKLAEEFYKPTIVLEKTKMMFTGSARTAGDFNLIEALKFASPHLLKFGGHKQAAGLSLEYGQFENFYQQLLIFSQGKLGDSETSRTLELEAELDDSQLSIVNCQLLQSLEPFGVDNPRPKFLVKNATVSSLRPVGQDDKHLQLQLRIGNKAIAAIYFSAGEIAKSLKIGDNLDVAAEIIEDGWNGKKDVKLKIIDIRNK